jgi:hypothetical protein
VNAAAPLEAHEAPHSRQAEQDVLGPLLSPEGAAAWQRIAPLGLKAGDFFDTNHLLIFGTISGLVADGKMHDVDAVAEQIGVKVPRDYLVKLARDSITSATVEVYAARVRELAERRRQANAKKGADESSDEPTAPEPFEIEPASRWAERVPPPPRDWIIEDLAMAAGRVTSFLGNGGFGKTAIALQLAVAVALSRPIFGKAVAGGTVVGFFCEDEQDELERRGRAICAAEGYELEGLDNLHLLSRDGEDNVLCAFERDQIIFTANYWRVDATLARYKPRLTIWDTAADAFAGDFLNPTQVRQFIKVGLGGFCARHGTALVLLAHPSSSAMATGDGGGFSTAWNNSVRSRLYLRRPKSEDAEAIADRRVLEIKKSNYGPTGGAVPLVYHRGRFILDPNPIEEGAKVSRPSKANTRLAVAILTYFRAQGSSCDVVSFGKLFEAMQQAGEIDRTANPETTRKALQRTLKHLVDEKLLATTEVPKGYRLTPTGPESST